MPTLTSSGSVASARSPGRRIAIAVGVLGAGLALFVGLLLGASELAGEVVVLRTRAASGELQQTRLWVVDVDGTPWLRAGHATSSWYRRLLADPQVELVRGGGTEPRRASPQDDAAARERINAAMRERYGAPDRWLDVLRDPATTVPVRLDPIP